MFVHLIRLVNLSNLHQKFQFVDVLLCPAARPVFVMQVKGWFTYYATDSGRTILENLLRLFTIRTRKTKVWKKHEIKKMPRDARCETVWNMFWRPRCVQGNGPVEDHMFESTSNILKL